MNMTQFAPFESIKKSMMLRSMINRKPAVIRLLTEEEYLEYYNDLANRYGTNPEDEMMEAQDKFAALMNKRAYVAPEGRDAVEESPSKKEEVPAEPDSRVVGLCIRSDKEEYGTERMRARDVLEALEVIEGELTEVDWNYLISNIEYATVKDYALKKLSSK